LVISPDRFLGSLETDALRDYERRREERQRLRYPQEHEFLAGRAPLVALKTEPPYDAATERSVYLNPEARVAWDIASRNWRFTGSKSGGAARPEPPEPRPSSLSERNAERLISADLRRAARGLPEADFG